MIDKNIFREYDIRGVYPKQINEKTAYTIGRAYGSYIQEHLNKNICVVGRDNRLSSPSLSANLMAGITDSGCDVIDCGLVTTPMYYYACIYTKAIIGIMVTASHNPKNENGFKFSFDEFGNARGKMVYDFRDYVLAGNFRDGNGIIEEIDVFSQYKNAIFKAIKMGSKQINVVIDCANGTTSLYAKEINSMFDNLNITMLYDESDGNFPNHHPDPLVKENMLDLQKKVKEIGADIGIGYDGDGDRIGIIDNLGHIVSIDQLMSLFIKDLSISNKKNTYLFDVKCSKVIEDVIASVGGNGICYRSGNSYTRSKVNEDKLIFGGELSGHVFFNDRWPCIDSGIYNGLRIMELLSKSDKTLSEMVDNLPKYYNTPELKIKVTDDNKFKIVDDVIIYCQNKNYSILTIDGCRVNFDDGWALIRASNTGPNLTLRFEATNKVKFDAIQNEFMTLIDSLKIKYVI